MEYIHLTRKFCLAELLPHLSIGKINGELSFSSVFQQESACNDGLTFFDGDVYQGDHSFDSVPIILSKKSAEKSLKHSFRAARTFVILATVSSSIPLLLDKYLLSKDIYRVLICGFGLGLSWATNVIEKVKK